MALNNNQIELLNTIKSGLKYGDLRKIAEKTGFSREWVGKVLSSDSSDFNEDIVKEAVALISNRQQYTKHLLKKVTSF